ncbi:MAG: DUF3232 domain-containing protein [Candidatus Woesearchaeota archaeon]
MKKDAKEKFNKLIDSIKETKDEFMSDDLDMVNDCIKDCATYIERVVAMEAAIKVLRFRLEPEKYRSKIADLDRARKDAHNALIASINAVNRMTTYYNVEPIYNGEDDRYAKAEFAKAVVDIYFKERNE